MTEAVFELLIIMVRQGVSGPALEHSKVSLVYWREMPLDGAAFVRTFVTIGQLLGDVSENASKVNS